MNHPCQKCQKNEASHFFTHTRNGEKTTLAFCSDCAPKSYSPFQFSPNSHTVIYPLSGDPLNTSEFDSDNDDYTQPTDASFAPKTTTRARHSILDDFGSNLNALAADGKIDPITQREKEIHRVIQILNLRNKNNPVILGEPGVGKTAIVEGLALQIVEGKVPDKLADKTIYSLDVGAITAGTSFRGQFEARVKAIIEEATSRDDVILFIDELHTIVNAGQGQEGELDFSNMLKPQLAKGTLQLIGATTLKEYRKIEKDSALERRFQPVKVNEPSVAETITILKHLQPIYENYHNVTYDEEAITACAKLADRYITERFMPDKAIDLLDEVGSRMNLNLSNLTDEEKAEVRKLSKLMNKYAAIEDFENANKYKYQRAQLIENKTSPISKEDVAEIVEDMTGIPVTKLTDEERNGLSNLEEDLNQAVIGQPNAIKEVVKAVKRKRFNLRSKKKPIVLFFAGPTGVGKTELTTQLTINLFGSKRNLIRYDMSEFKEPHSISKLIGAPPGYQGFERGGTLTEKVRRNPYSLILFDEFEKAHSEVRNLFLQLFDEGRLTDSQDKTVDFSNTVIIMTSNLGANAPKSTGFVNENTGEMYISTIHSAFSPEFINRIDKVIPFNHLTQNDLLKIVDIQLADLMNVLQEEKGITLTVSDASKEWLVKKGFNEKLGARPLARTIAEEVDDKITELLLAQKNSTISSISVTVENDKLIVTHK